MIRTTEQSVILTEKPMELVVRHRQTANAPEQQQAEIRFCASQETIQAFTLTYPNLLILYRLLASYFESREEE